jgi:LmbE family N-acetylglucosaminyl deacetylase
VKAAFHGRIVVLSPHLDDAALSLGAGLSRASRTGQEVTSVTVFANDPDSEEPAAEWDAECGFSSAGEAARGRRREDEQACSAIGARPVWLPFTDADHGSHELDDAIVEALAQAVADADVVLAPGFPLAHSDHERLTRLLLEHRPTRGRIGLYVEQPYAAWRYIGRGRRSWAAPGLTPAAGARNAATILLRTPRGRALQRPSFDETFGRLDGGGTAVGATLRDRIAKHRALRAYASQLEGFGRLTPAIIEVYERGFGGEGVAWLGPS